jgi:glucosamine--fructose-6-phosphate aminotransferase (isomerizing)
MCGIIGYTGKNKAVEYIISGLESLEYRGYDSAGFAININNETKIYKCVGSPENLKKASISSPADTGIGHTRWATHGPATEQNAHPHTSQNGLFTIVHNGIIENYSELKEGLINNRVKLRSETDSEIIAHLLEENYNGDLKGTVTSVLPLLKGAYALAILCKDYPDTIVCAKLSSPIFVGTDIDEAFISSDATVIAEHSKRLYRLNDGEIGIVTKDSFKVYDIDGCRIRKTEIKINSKKDISDKCGYKHYMLKEIYEQPDVLRRILSDVLQENKFGFKDLKWSPEELKSINNVHFVACGSAYHVGVTGAYICEELFKRNAAATVASEYRYKYPLIESNTLVVIISQSGETADTIAAMRIAKEKGAKIISIVNVENSTIAMESDCVILTCAGKEIAVATTKAYIAQLTVIYSLMMHLALITGELLNNEYSLLTDEIKTLPDKITKTLENAEHIKNFTDSILESEYICFIGRNLEYTTALEAALKLKEISYIPCEAYAAGELKHGTISLINEKSLCIALNCSKRLRAKISSNICEIKARKGKIITLTTEIEQGDITIPETNDIFYPLLEVIPLQLLAYFTAEKNGCEIDKPKNLAKSVTVE